MSKEIGIGMARKRDLVTGRKEFLKTMGLGSISLIIPGVSLRPDLITQLVAKPIKIYDNFLRGGQY